MNIAYIVTSGCYSDYRIDKVFLDKALAEAYLEEFKKVSSSYDAPSIEEWEIEEKLEKIARQYWQSHIDLITGEIKHFFENDAKYIFESPETRIGACSNIKDIPYATGFIPKEVYFSSYVSQEHADKLAIEARQEFIRRVDITKVTQPPKAHRFSPYYYEPGDKGV